MNNPNPFVPQGSLLEQQSQRRFRLKIAVSCVLTVCIGSLAVMLIQGCKREQPTDTGLNTPPAESTNNSLPAANAALPPDTNSNALAAAPSNTVPPPPPPAPVVVTPPPVPAAVEPAAGSEYVVVQGDSLAKIAKAQGVSLKALQAANPGVDPKKLKIKQKLVIPAKAPEATGATPAAGAAVTDAGGATYTVKSGDTLGKIAKKNGVTLKALRAANAKIASTDHIHVGDKLTIPSKAETAAPTPVPEAVTPSAVPPSSAPAPVAPAPAPGH